MLPTPNPTIYIHFLPEDLHVLFINREEESHTLNAHYLVCWSGQEGQTVDGLFGRVAHRASQQDHHDPVLRVKRRSQSMVGVVDSQE